MAIKKIVEIDIKSDSKQAQSSFKSIKKDLDSVGDSAKKNLSDEGFKKITKELKNTEKAVKSTKTRLRELEDEMADIGDVGSPQFQKLAKEAGVLKDKTNNAKAAVKAMSSDFPKLQVGTQAFQAMGGAAQGAMGAMALVGGENEMVTKSIQKMMAVQSILNSVTAISNALSDETALGLKVRTLLGQIKTANDIKQANSTKGLTLAQKGMTAATWVANKVTKVFNKTLLSNPIFWIVAVIMAVIAAFKIFSSSTESAEESNNKLNNSIEKQNRLMEANRQKSKQVHDDRMRLLALNDATEKEMHDANLDRLKEVEDGRKEDLKSTGSLISKKQRLYRRARAEGENDLAKELGKEIRDNKKKLETLKGQRNNYNYSVREANKEFNAGIAADNDAAADEADKKRATNLSNWKASQSKKLQERRKILDLENSLIEDKTERAIEIRREKYRRELEDLKVNKENRAEIERLMEEKLNADLAAINKVEEDKETAKLKEFYAKQDALEIELMAEGNEKKKAKKTAEFEAKIVKLTEQGLITNEIEKQLAQDLADFKQGLDDKVREDKALKEDAADKKADDDAKKKIAAERELANARLDMAAATFQSIGTLATLFAKDDEASQRKAFNINKATSIAMATISTYQAAQSAYASQMLIPSPDAPVRAAVAAGAAVVSGLANVATIAKTKFQGGGGATAPAGLSGVSSGGGGGSPASFNVVGNTGINQLAQGLSGQDNVTKTFVVASDVTTAQGLERDRMDLVTL
jgi:hypothetical protein